MNSSSNEVHNKLTTIMFHVGYIYDAAFDIGSIVNCHTYTHQHYAKECKRYFKVIDKAIKDIGRNLEGGDKHE